MCSSDLKSAQTLDSGETKEKEERTRSSKKPAALTSLKNLACHEGLDCFSVVKSLTKACMPQNCFTSVKKIKKL